MTRKLEELTGDGCQGWSAGKWDSHKVSPTCQRQSGDDVEDDEQSDARCLVDEVLEDHGDDDPCDEVCGRNTEVPGADGERVDAISVA